LGSSPLIMTYTI